MLKKAKIRDRKAPRFRWSKYRHIVLTRELHKRYLQRYEDGVKEYSIFKNIIEDFNTAVCDQVVKNRDGVKLPSMMGIMALCSFKPRKRVPLDWLKIDDTGLQIRDFNIDTNELMCKIVYSSYTSKYKFKMNFIWKFEGYRGFKNKASSAFRKNYNYYKRMDNKMKVSKLFRDDYRPTNFRSTWNEQRMDSGQQDN